MSAGVQALAELVSQLSDTVHAHTTAFSVVSAARVHNLWAWDDGLLGLDVVQVHSYPDTNHPRRDVIDLKTLQVAGRIATGPGPDGLAWVARSPTR